MPHHVWNDGWEYWDRLHQAISEVSGVLHRWQILYMGKEKFGCYQLSIYPWDGMLTHLIWPSVYTRQTWWAPLDCAVIAPVLRKIGCVRVVNWVHRQVVNWAIQRACRRYPEVVDELVADIDCYTWVRPGIFGDVDGERIRNKYWKTYEVDV